MSEKETLTIEEVAARLRKSRQTLAHWRVRGYGPPFFKAGRDVLYRLDAVREWEKSQERQSTTQPRAA